MATSEINIREEINNLQILLNNILPSIENENELYNNEKKRKKELDKVSVDIEDIENKIVSITNEINNYCRNENLIIKSEKQIYLSEKKRISDKKELLRLNYTLELQNNIKELLLLQCSMIQLNGKIALLNNRLMAYKDNKVLIRNKYLCKVGKMNGEIKEKRINKSEIELYNLKINKLELELSLITNEKYNINKDYYDYLEEYKKLNEYIKNLSISNNQSEFKYYNGLLLELETDIRNNPKKRIEELENKKRKLIKQIKIFKKDLNRLNTNTSYNSIKSSLSDIKLPNTYKIDKELLTDANKELLNTKKLIFNKQLQIYLIEDKLLPENINDEVLNDINRCDQRWNIINNRVEQRIKEYKESKNSELASLRERLSLLQIKKNYLLTNFMNNNDKQNTDKKVNNIKSNNNELNYLNSNKIEKNNELLNSIKNRIKYLSVQKLN